MLKIYFLPKNVLCAEHERNMLRNNVVYFRAKEQEGDSRRQTGVKAFARGSQNILKDLAPMIMINVLCSIINEERIHKEKFLPQMGFKFLFCRWVGENDPQLFTSFSHLE